MSELPDLDALARQLRESGAFSKDQIDALVRAMRRACHSRSFESENRHARTMACFDRFERNVVTSVAWIAVAALVFFVMLSRSIA